MIKTQEALAMVGGHVNEELLLRNEYLATENEILRNKLQSKISFRYDLINQGVCNPSWL